MTADTGFDLLQRVNHGYATKGEEWRLFAFCSCGVKGYFLVEKLYCNMSWLVCCPGCDKQVIVYQEQRQGMDHQTITEIIRRLEKE
jgi:hypothetical protein